MRRRGRRPPLRVTLVVPTLAPLAPDERGYKCGDRTHWAEAFDGVAQHPAIGWTVVALASAHRPPLEFNARLHLCEVCARRLGVEPEAAGEEAKSPAAEAATGGPH